MIAQFLFAFYRVRATMMWKRKPNGHFAAAVLLFYPWRIEKQIWENMVVWACFSLNL